MTTKPGKLRTIFWYGVVIYLLHIMDTCAHGVRFIGG